LVHVLDRIAGLTMSRGRTLRTSSLIVMHALGVSRRS
jgi:hypothetical protein